MENISSTHTIFDYSDLLKTYGLSYVPFDLYWQVGEIKLTQGWILHLSVTSYQLRRLLEQVLPELLAQQLPFRVIRDAFLANSLAEGSLGYTVLGKMVSIYPENDARACAVARILIGLTEGFQGPAIPTDRHLGGIVYTRYGSFSPVLVKSSNGEWVKHIYNRKGQLVADPYEIPFRMPEGPTWPFGDIASPEAPVSPKLLNYKYYPLQVLKPDAKGAVIKGLYFKKPWQIRSCIIKEGRPHMFADEYGRDIRNRLKWQFRLYKALHKDIPMPEVFDHFEANGSDYLAMQFIKGQTLSAWIADIYQDRSWYELNLPQRLQLLDQLLRIVSIIECMHKKGYVHRDITPENFMLDKKGSLFLIDMELTWYAWDDPVQPPFKQGTPGHMSPEQQMVRIPSFKEDIYALGSMTLTFLSNLFALKITGQSETQLQAALDFFIDDPTIAQLIKSCWENDPSRRPTLDDIKGTLSTYVAALSREDTSSKTAIPSLSDTTVRRTIQAGLDYLVHPSLLSPKNRWISLSRQKETHIGNQQSSMELYEGWHTGMAGPLWLAALAKRMGFAVEVCEYAYTSSWGFIHDNYFDHPERILPGLYGGSAGIALAISEGLHSDLLNMDSTLIERLQQCFSTSASTPELSNGISGQGLALLQCRSWLDGPWVKEQLDNYIKVLLKLQRVDGAWNSFTGVNAGTAGVLLFLLSYVQIWADDKVMASVVKALDWLKGSRIRTKKGCYWPLSVEDKRTDKWSMSSGNPGICLAFIKAYQVFSGDFYRNMAEECLLQLPDRPVLLDLTLASGLAGIGEVYLEAGRIFQDSVWQERTGWIEQQLLACRKDGENEGSYWLTAQHETTTADLFFGNSGILHFLLRCLYPEKIKHPLL
jgi:serine/threonine protein kinase